MTSSNGNIFRVSDPLCGEFTGHRWMPWINGWVNNGEAGDLRRHRAHYDITVMGDVLWHLPESNFAGNALNIYSCYQFEIGSTSPYVVTVQQWVKYLLSRKGAASHFIMIQYIRQLLWFCVSSIWYLVITWTINLDESKKITISIISPFFITAFFLKTPYYGHNNLHYNPKTIWRLPQI